MKLLFDQNLSPRAVKALESEFPGSIHVREVHLQEAPDQMIWEFAAEHGLTIVTKDADFNQRSFLFGHPPKVIWIRRGNCSTNELIDLLRGQCSAIQAFQADPGSSLLTLE